MGGNSLGPVRIPDTGFVDRGGRVVEFTDSAVTQNGTVPGGGVVPFERTGSEVGVQLVDNVVVTVDSVEPGVDSVASLGGEGLLKFF